MMLSPKALQQIKKRRKNLYVNFPLDIDKTVLLIIDMQNVFCAPGALIETPEARNIVPNINLIAETCRLLSVPVIFIRHVTMANGADIKRQLSFFDKEKHAHIIEQLTPGNWGSEIFNDLNVSEKDLIIEKCRFSALAPGSSSLERLLRSLQKDTVIVTGTRTNICCESTVRDAMMLDFKVIVVGDGTAALEQEEHQHSLDVMGDVFADVVSTRYLVEELKSGRRK